GVREARGDGEPRSSCGAVRQQGSASGKGRVATPGRGSRGLTRRRYGGVGNSSRARDGEGSGRKKGGRPGGRAGGVSGNCHYFISSRPHRGDSIQNKCQRPMESLPGQQ